MCRSLLEPIRTSNPFATYVEAACDSLDVDKKVCAQLQLLLCSWTMVMAHCRWRCTTR